MLARSLLFFFLSFYFCYSLHSLVSTCIVSIMPLKCPLSYDTLPHTPIFTWHLVFVEFISLKLYGAHHVTILTMELKEKIFFFLFQHFSCFFLGFLWFFSLCVKMCEHGNMANYGQCLPSSIPSYTIHTFNSIILCTHQIFV